MQKSHDKHRHHSSWGAVFFAFLWQKEFSFFFFDAFTSFHVIKNEKTTNRLRHFPRAKRSKIVEN